jgi:uncharacterized membrane protein
MTEALQTSQPESRFRALLTPHRSLGPKGFLILMSVICAISFGTGFAFFLMGAWPVFGFCGLDVLLVYVAFKASYRSGRLLEVVDLTDDNLTVTRVQPSGNRESWVFNPYWVRVSVSERVGRSSEMSLASHGTRLVIGAFLTDQEREEFAGALKRALADATTPDLAPQQG